MESKVISLMHCLWRKHWLKTPARPLNPVLPRMIRFPMRLAGGLDTVALRCPDHAGCREFLKAAGVPVAGPSANLPVAPVRQRHPKLYDMEGRSQLILDGGSCTVGAESIIVEVLTMWSRFYVQMVMKKCWRKLLLMWRRIPSSVTGKGVPKAPARNIATMHRKAGTGFS